MVSALFLSGTVAATSNSADLNLSISGLRNAKGQVMACLTADPKAFPDCRRDANAHKRMVAAANAKTILFDGVEPGIYAISLIHDENGNGKLDTAVMIPNEGFGFSRNPIVTFGPPTFKSAAFVVGNTGATQSVKMQYIL